MDLGIAGNTAIVCAASKGLGRACAFSLARNGVDLVINARGAEALEATAREIRDATGVRVQTVAADVTTESGRSARLAACPDPDILVNNAGGPPPGDFREWGEKEWLAAVRANMLTPIELIRATIDKMAAKASGGSSTSPRRGEGPHRRARPLQRCPRRAHGFRRGRGPRDGALRCHGEQHPARSLRHRPPAHEPGLGGQEARPAARAGDRGGVRRPVPGRRFGDPHEFGELCAFLCSRQAGYITGQNILIDGGAFPGTL